MCGRNKTKKRQDTGASVQLVKHGGGPSIMLSKKYLEISENQKMASSLIHQVLTLEALEK